MTAQPASLDLAAPGARGGIYLGFRTVLRKELTDWLRGRGALVVAGISTAIAAFTTVIPFVVKASGDAAGGPPLSMDPTANVLLGWQGGQTIALTAILATMALLTTERDRGTLAWNLTNPVAPASIVAAKFVAAGLVLGATAVVLPLAVSIAIAAVVYGALPNITTVATFAVLFLTLPLFYIALTVALGTFIKSTAGVAGIAILVLFAPAVISALLPAFADLSPTSVGTWALAAATGRPAAMLTPISWLLSMVALFVAAKLIFDRQEL